MAHCSPDSPSRSDRGITTGEPGQPRRTPWTEVHQKALRAAGFLIGAAAPGLQHGDAVAVLAGDPALIAPAVQGVWLAGGSVTMLHQPTPRADLASWASDTVRALGMINAKLVLLGSPFDRLAPLLDQRGISYLMLGDLDNPAVAPLSAPVPVDEDDTALLQLTSGSTASPKAVRITHGNLFSNMTAMAQVARLDAEHD
ncbi:MAG: AMP-binding protein, partial [Actinomycetota bacterium]|nr:AMP-binding protein [Actinomycetota bacterium]